MKKTNKSCFKNSIPVPGTSESLAQQGFHDKAKKCAPRLASNKTESESQLLDKNRGLLYAEFKNRMSDMITYSQPYKKAILYNAGGNINKRWYVYFWYLYPGSPDKYKRFREEFGINQVKTIGERTKFGKELVSFINQKLKQGFNPFTDATQDPQLAGHGILQQLDRIRLQMSNNASIHQKETYREIYRRFQRWIDETERHTIDISHINLEYVTEFKNWCLHKKNLTAKTTNNSLSHLGMFWDIAEQYRLVTHNPFRIVSRARKRDKPKDENEIERFEPLNDQEMKAIFQSFRETKQQPFLNYCAFIYYAWIRPVELLRLRVGDIDETKGSIHLKSSQTKNGKSATVQIVPPLAAIIKDMHLEKYDPSLYLFSLNYVPGKTQMGRRNPSNKWRHVVKTKLKINKDMYALKHTGNIEYLLQNKDNVNLKWQQLQNRHHSQAQTEAYNRRIGAYFINMEKVNFRTI